MHCRRACTCKLVSRGRAHSICLPLHLTSSMAHRFWTRSKSQLKCNTTAREKRHPSHADAARSRDQRARRLLFVCFRCLVPSDTMWWNCSSRLFYCYCGVCAIRGWDPANRAFVVIRSLLEISDTSGNAVAQERYRCRGVASVYFCKRKLSWTKRVAWSTKLFFVMLIYIYFHFEKAKLD